MSAERKPDPRQVFEDQLWAYYQRIKAAGWKSPEEGDASSRESLFWRRAEMPEMYGVLQVQAAWQGFLMAWDYCHGVEQA